MDHDEFIRRTLVLKTRDRIDFITTSVFMAVCFVVGALALLDVIPLPRSLTDTLHSYAHFSWATMLVLGSAMSFVGRVRNFLEVEAAGSLALALAFGTYVASIMYANSFGGLAVAAVFLGLVVKYGYRGYVLNKLSRDARRGRIRG